ncbi:hypothetical protein ACA910_014591 [Epithemia clementina (nom. ined.)]
MISSGIRRCSLSILRRRFSSVPPSNARIGELKPRKPTVTGASSASAPNARVPPPIAEPSEVVEITPEIQRNNVLVASFLLVFCGAVFMYSLRVVGQTGPLNGNDEDPVQALKKEAEAAQQKKLRESQDMVDAQEMIKKAEAYDPDGLAELEKEEEEELNRRRKKPWWKVW